MKHMNSRRILAMLLALCMMACLLSMTAFAADPLPAEADPDVWDTIVLTKEDGTKLVAGTDYTVTRGVYSHYAYTEPFKYNIYNVTTTDAIVISGGASYSNSSLTNPLKSRISLGAAVTSVTLQNVTALGELSIADGSSVTFTLKNENNIDYIYGKGETTNMTFEGDGSLTGKHIGGVNKYGAAKGTNIGCNITINSGTFNITAGYEAAIGGGQYGDSGKIVINGGNITAKSNYGAAIGGGQYGDAAAIEISSGEINATGSFGAAIGGGQSGDAKEIGIEGGVINARGSHVGAAIGGGQNGNVGKIKITDGDITVVARNMAIGGETADDISISGGNIKLGKLDSSSKEVTPDASQIGSKSSSETSTVTITGGTFKSTDDDVVNVSAYVPEDCTYNPETGEVTGAPSYVAYIGEQGYTTLEEAIEAVQNGETVEIAVSDTYSREALNKLSNQSKNVTIKAREGVVAVIDMSDAVTMSNSGTTTFENITFQYTTADYRGLQHAGNVVYNSCKINGTVFLYGTSEIFNKCVFTQTSTSDGSKYNVWVYGTPHAEFNNCTFNNAGKTIHVYNENNEASNPQLAETNVTLNSCTVKSTKESGNKSVVNIKTDKVPTELKLAGTNKVYYNETDITDATRLYVFSLYQGTEKPDSVKDSYVYEVTVNEQGEEVLTQLATTAKATGVAKITRDGTDVGTYATLAEAFEKAKDGDTITLLKDSSGNGIMVEANKFATGLTVDFGGYTYTFNGKPVGSTGSETQAAHFESGNKITLKNGTFDVDATAGANVVILVQNYADLTLDNMTLNGANVAITMLDRITLSTNNGTVTANNTKIIAPKKQENTTLFTSYAIAICGFQNYEGTSVTVTGENSAITGDIKFSKEAAANDSTYALNLALNEGAVSGSLSFGKDLAGVTMTVTKGENVTVTPPAGYEWRNNVLVKLADAVAKTGGESYPTLQEAIDAAASDATVTLMANITVDESVVINKNLTLKLSSYTITGAAGVEVLQISSTDTSTIKVILQGDNLNGGIDGGSGGSNKAIVVGKNAELTIKSGTYTVGGDEKGEGNSTIFVKENGKVNILGGKFSSKEPWRGFYYVLNRHNGCDGTFIVKGGTFINYNPLKGDDNDGGNFCGPLYGIKTEKNEKDGSVSYIAKQGSLQVLDEDGEPVNVYKNSQLETLLTNLKDGQTVMLLSNTTLSSQMVIDKAITLDLNEKVLTSTYAENSYAIDVKADATIKNGSISAVTYGMQAKANVTIDGVKLSTSGPMGLVVQNANAPCDVKIMNTEIVAKDHALFDQSNNNTITISKSTLKAGESGINHSGRYYGYNLTVTDSMIIAGTEETSDSNINTTGVYISGSTETAKHGMQKATFTNCTIKGGTGVEVKYTDLTLDNCTVVSTYGTPSYKQNSNGAATAGFAVVSTDTATQGATPAPVGTVKITGENGVYTGLVGLGALERVKADYPNFTDNTIKVSAGKFNRQLESEYCADGYEPTTTADSNGYYTVKVAEGDVKLIKTDGTTSYIYLANAKTATESGDKIELFQNATTSMAYIKNGVTLDLNGHELMADFIMAASGQVIDSTEGQGLLKVNESEILLNQMNSSLPLFDTEAGGYRLFSYELKPLGTKNDNGSSCEFWFTIVFGDRRAYTLLQSGTHGLKVFVQFKLGENNAQYVSIPQSTINLWVNALLRTGNEEKPFDKFGYALVMKGLDKLDGRTLVLSSIAETSGVEATANSTITYQSNSAN